MAVVGGLPAGSQEVLALLLAEGRANEPVFLARVEVEGAALASSDLFRALERLEAAGWVVWSDGGYELTAAGVGIAGTLG